MKKLSEQLQLFDPLHGSQRDRWGEAVDVLAEALYLWACKCQEMDAEPTAHAGDCPYRIAMKKAGCE